jgi:hypothetical protein
MAQVAATPSMHVPFAFDSRDKRPNICEAMEMNCEPAGRFSERNFCCSLDCASEMIRKNEINSEMISQLPKDLLTLYRDES